MNSTLHGFIPLRKVKHILFFSYLAMKRGYRRLTGKPIIHVFGDSHSRLMQHELFKIHHVGPATAFRLSSHKSITQGNVKIKKHLKIIARSKNLLLLFVFGEIDCRIHINKSSILSNISIAKATLNTVESYGKFLLDIKKNYPNSCIMVLNALPSGEQKNIYKTKYYPPRSLQLKIVKNFNEKLNKFCIKHELIFLSVFNELLDKNENRIKKYIFDQVHYDKRIVPFIIHEIKSKGVI